jgi:hypothetical protein
MAICNKIGILILLSFIVIYSNPRVPPPATCFLYCEYVQINTIPKQIQIDGKYLFKLNNKPVYGINIVMVPVYIQENEGTNINEINFIAKWNEINLPANLAETYKYDSIIVPKNTKVIWYSINVSMITKIIKKRVEKEFGE